MKTPLTFDAESHGLLKITKDDRVDQGVVSTLGPLRTDDLGELALDRAQVFIRHESIAENALHFISE